MKLNSLTNSLAGNDKSLSNSYLQHIVELLRTEVASLTAKESALEEITKEHIETQKKVVDTETVNTDKLYANTITTGSINEKIILTNVVDVLTELKVNGKDVLTDASFSGPFTYKGVVETLPVDAVAGDVYITNDKVNIYNGTGWDEFTLPVGTVSLAEYNEDKAETLSKIADVQVDVSTVKDDLTATKTTLNEAVIDINDINTSLETKVTDAPVDDNSYVRKNGGWVDLTSADNTVKHTSGESVIDNSENGIKIESPKVEITTQDFKINGSELPEVDKLALSKTTETDTNYWYELKYGRSPFDASSSVRPAYSGYGNSRSLSRSNPTIYTIFTKNWQYTKWASTLEATNDSLINITAMDKDGNINLISGNFNDWNVPDTKPLRYSCFMSFNPEYAPEGYEDAVWLFCPGLRETQVQKVYLVELKDGKFSRKINIYDGAGGLKEQGYSPVTSISGMSWIGLTGGKSLRSKDTQRICMTLFDVGNTGSSFAIIIGGDKNSKATDPFDPSKCIYVKLPSTAYYGYQCMAATDSAWYLQEYETGRIMRLTPNGQVVELNLTATDWACAFSYIEYTDINNKPAVAYFVQDTKTSGKNYVLFLEEGDNGQVNFTERLVTSSAYTPSDRGIYSQYFKFMENSYYIFFTADCGSTVSGDVEYGSASMKNMLWYWDKKTHTTHAINNFYEGITFGEHDFIEMHKTKGNAIWFPYLRQELPESSRTGDLHYISDVDYTNINADTGVDEGEIQVHTANVGTKYSFFTSFPNDIDMSFLFYTHNLQASSDNYTQWPLSCARCQLSATNDDGILCIISGDVKSIALCYGDGNIRTYPISIYSSGVYRCDGDKDSYLPDFVDYVKDWDKQPNLSGMSHGWLYQIYSYPLSTILPTAQVASYTYIGLKYKNGEPNILEAPYLSKIVRCGECKCPQRIKWEKYGYSQTYDDYERRKQTLGGIRAYINYGGASTGADGYFKEVISGGKEKLNLTYNGKVISSVDE